jgi:c-di-GMP-binding flagellar brake protein YcgR
MSHKAIPLKVEHFYHDEDLDFRISSKREMLSIFQAIMGERAQVALFYSHNQKSLLTTLIGVAESGIWLDVSPYPPDNKQILLSDKTTFVTTHRQVKVQFTTPGVENSLFEGESAFYADFPEFLLRIQRREHFRVNVPAHPPVRCIIPIPQESPEEPPVMRAVQVVNISLGGIGFMCGPNEVMLTAPKTFPNCKISIPEVGNLLVTVEVCSHFKVLAPGGTTHTHIGCKFIELDSQANILLQRYIARLQSESLSKQ